MVKIKQIKEMSLPELIQWGWDNPRLVESKWIKQKDTTLEGVYFSKLNRVVVRDFVSKDDTFTVEVEEEITEETEIPTLIGLYKYDCYQIMYMRSNTSIKKVISNISDDLKAKRKAFYMLNDDYTMSLLWKDGEMVG